MIQVNNILCDNDLSKEDLINHMIVTKTSYSDAKNIIAILAKCFGLYSQEEALMQLLQSKANLNESIKLIDERNGDIYGVLILSEFPMHVGSPIVEYDYNKAWKLSKYRQLNGHSFIIDERLRGCKYDKEMLSHNNQFIEQYDVLWCAVENSLKSQKYWKRFGFNELFKNREATFYIKIKDKKIFDDIYTDEVENLLKNEENNN